MKKSQPTPKPTLQITQGKKAFKKSVAPMPKAFKKSVAPMPKKK